MNAIENYKGRYVFHGQKVSAFFNLHSHLFSLQGKLYEQYQKGFSVINPENKKRNLVLAHGNGIILLDAKFTVRESGRQRVLKEKRKNVHAFVNGSYGGTLWEIVDSQEMLENDFREAYYNPYKQDCFTDKLTGEKLDGAEFVVLLDKKVYYKN